MVTILLLTVQNFNSFIIPWIMTGGGPVGSTHIWITHIYELRLPAPALGRGAAYAVLLFIIMMVLGYFYVRALTRGDEIEGRSMSTVTMGDRPVAKRSIDGWRWSGRIFLVGLLLSTPSCRWRGC
jgi:hypothetical protein